MEGTFDGDERFASSLLHCMEELEEVVGNLVAAHGPEALVHCLKEQVGTSLKILMDRRVLTPSQVRAVIYRMVRSSFITSEEPQAQDPDNVRFVLKRRRDPDEDGLEDAVEACNDAVNEPLLALAAKTEALVIVAALTEYLSGSLRAHLHIGSRTRLDSERILQSLNEMVFEDAESLRFDADAPEPPADEIARTPLAIPIGHSNTIADFVHASLRRIGVGD